MTLPDKEQRIFDEDLEDYERKNEMPFITSIERKGLEKGREEGLEQGRQEGQRDSLATVLKARFGALTQELLQRLEEIQDESTLRNLTELAATTPDLSTFELELTDTKS